MSIGDFIRNSQVWKSIFRHPAPRDRRNRVVVMLTNFFLHLHPVSVRKSGIALSYTWCMGGMTFFLFLVETVTGVLLMFYYRPTLEHAYNDILALRDVTTLGILRELHRWGAHAMVITIWLHMYRVFLTGSYKPPREFNWGVGVILLVLTLLLIFTGYLLPWDQLAIWAITVGSNMARATPFLGYEGPGRHVPEDRRRRPDPLRLATRGSCCWAAGSSARDADALLRAALRRDPAGRGAADRDPLLARAQGRRHQRAAVESAVESAGSARCSRSRLHRAELSIAGSSDNWTAHARHHADLLDVGLQNGLGGLSTCSSRS